MHRWLILGLTCPLRNAGVKTPGTIFAMDFDMATRAASVQFLSQYPHGQDQ